VLNYVHALEYGLQRVETLPVSKRLMLELHERLLHGVRGERATPGEFRRSQNWIGRPGSALVDADFVPPPVSDMLDALDALEKYIHDEEAPHPPLLRLAFIHYQFEAIHPFLDGNGRIGRLLLSLLLVNWQLLPLPLLCLSAYFERNRQAYYDRLMAVSAQSAWRDWAEFFLAGVAEQACDASDRAKRVQDLQVEWHRRLARGRGSTRLVSLADHLFGSPIISIPKAARLLGLSYPAAGNNVEKLVQAGILKPLGEASHLKTYIAGDILDIITPSRVEN
jgi:Fic family protein